MSDIPFQDEIRHLAEINDRLDAALSEADAHVERIDKDYIEAKRYMVEYRGEIDPHEMFQSELLLKQTDRAGAFAVGVRDKIAKLKGSPYFARIDFREEGDGKALTYYIGRFAFSHQEELLIFDWRAPLASMFYDCELGAAGYEAPAGRIDGMLTKKRQFKIENGAMVYALENSSNIQDDVLQRELSHTSDEKMKSIISTIQKEQNQIIRSEGTGTLIIQGVAGSGKTSIALHRIAFLLYRFKKQLSAQNVAILSPNKVFGDYISNVIPELGEEPICELSLLDIAKVQLEKAVDFEPDRDPMETKDEEWARRVRFKSTLQFVRLMDEYIAKLSETVFIPEDYTFGRFTASKEWIGARFRAYGKYPIRRRLDMIAADLHGRFEADNVMQEELPRAAAIRKSLNGMLAAKSSLAIYKDFYRSTGAPDMLVMGKAKTLEWADVYPFLYLRAAFDGLRESRITKHLVIDEMQDYAPIQYAVLNLLFPCPKTILGDFGQFINPNSQYTLEDMEQLYEDAEVVMLNKSYRSTCEIISFARHISSVGQMEAVERHGEEPQVIACSDEQAEIREIKGVIRQFEAGEYEALGIIMKTDFAARRLHAILAEECKVNLIAPESTSFRNGVSITSIRMAKGLEFDEVLIPDADSRTYAADYDRGLLYVACTRAMHRLTVLYTGERSPLISR